MGRQNYSIITELAMLVLKKLLINCTFCQLLQSAL